MSFGISSCCLIAKSCTNLCNIMSCITPGFPVLHHLPEFAQTHVHCVDDAIQPPNSLPPPSPSGLNPSQHQGKVRLSLMFFLFLEVGLYCNKLPSQNYFCCILQVLSCRFLIVICFQNIFYFPFNFFSYLLVIWKYIV